MVAAAAQAAPTPCGITRGVMKLLDRKLQQRVDAPGTSSKDSLNLRPRHTEVVSQLLDSVTAITANANGFNVDLSQFGRPVSLANRHGAVSVLIVRVFLTCAPNKIIEPIVRRLAVQMSRFMAWGTGAAIGLKHKAMDILRNVLAVTEQCYLLVGSPLSRNNRGLSARKLSTAKRENLSIFTDKIFGESNAFLHWHDYITGSLSVQ